MQQPEFIGLTVLALITITSLAVNVRALVATKNVQKREVTFGDEYVTKEFFRAEHTALAGRMEVLERGIVELRTERRNDMAQLYEKVNKVDRATAGLQAELTMVNQRIAQVDSKVDRLIERA